MYKLQNAWRSGPQQGPATPKTARLTTDAADHASSSQPRFDGLVLERVDDDGFEQWRDDATGAIIRRRLTWDDVIGKK